MKISRTAGLFLLVVWTISCSDTGSPVSDTNFQDAPLLAEVEESGPHLTAWREDFAESPAFVYRASPTEGDFLPLEGGQVSFWAVSGAERRLEVRYRIGAGEWLPYFDLVVPASGLSERSDGSVLAPGDSVLITVTLDHSVLLLELEPDGLTFTDHSPARLAWWYTGADPDLDDNGVVDAVDQLIEETLLGIQVQQLKDGPWELLPALKSLIDKRFDIELNHFSGYAVSW